MELKVKSKAIKLIVKTRKIIAIAREFKDNKFEDGFFTAIRECNIELLARIIAILSDKDEDVEEVYDFLDEYIAETGKTYTEIYMDIAKEINEKGFFRVKMTEEQLQARVDDIMSSMNYEDIIKKSIEKMATEVVTEEFKGYQA